VGKRPGGGEKSFRGEASEGGKQDLWGKRGAAPAFDVIKKGDMLK